MREQWRRRRNRWLAGVVSALVVVGAVGGWLTLRGGDSSAAAAPTTTEVTATTMKQTVSSTGTVDAAHTADLDFDVSGTVTKVYVKQGQKVSVGQPLAKVGRSELVAARTAAQASLSAAETQLTDDEDADASAVQLASDRSAIVSAQATLDQARSDLQDTVLRSTIAGQVTSLDLAVGDVVGSSSSGSGSSASASGTTGGSSVDASSSTSSSSSTAEVTVTSTGTYVVDGTVTASDVGELKKGMEAQVTVTGVTDTVYGTVSSVGAVSQTDSSGAAVFPVTIKLTGDQSDLFAGASATASITVKEIPNVLTVSSRALQTSGTTTYVMKMVNGQAVKTVVKTGTTYGVVTQILSGLKSGDTVQVPGLTLPSGGTGTRGTTGSGSGSGAPGGSFGGGGYGGGFAPGAAQ